MVVIKPIRETEKAVTLTRSDYEALLNAAEDAADLPAIDSHRAHEERVGWEAARAGYLTLDEAKRVWSGVPPLKVWREKRGLSQRALADAADVSFSYLAEIESGHKPGSVDALAKLARALRVRIDDLVISQEAA